jgi:hypothetical protein
MMMVQGSTYACATLYQKVPYTTLYATYNTSTVCGKPNA